MAKQRRCAETEVDTKKKEMKTQSKAAKIKKKDSDDVLEKDEKLIRKVNPKSRIISKEPVKKSTSTKSNVKSDTKTSKYFQSPVKEEDSEDDFDMETSRAAPIKANQKQPEKVEEMDDSEDDDDWEEVEELAEPLGPVDPVEPVLPSQPVEIEIETPEVRKQKKRQAEFETYLKRMVNRFKKDQLIDTHKVHLMCLIANGMFRNSLCSEPDLLGISLSLLPTHFSTVANERVDQNYLSGLLKWFRSTFTLNPDLPCEERQDIRSLLTSRLGSFSARDHQEMTHLFLLVLRSLQLFCRLVLSLQPIPFKPPSVKCNAAKNTTATSKKNQASQEASKSHSPNKKVSPGSKRPAEEGGNKRTNKGKKAKVKEIEEDEKPALLTGQKPKNAKRRSVASKISYKEESNSEAGEEQDSDSEDFQMTSEGDSEDSEGGGKFTKLKKGKGKTKNPPPAKKRGDGKKKNQVKEEKSGLEDSNDEDDDFVMSSKGKRRSFKKEGPGADEWLEVYLEKTSSWVCVDVDLGVANPHLVSQKATAPVTYVVAVDGNGFLKDLGKKYDPTWMTSSRKRRVDDEWWEDTLEPFLGPEDERNQKEEKELQNRLLSKPMPTSITEFKNHPLYALKRHLLKYEALYPSTATILGYCRGEAVYSRDCVQTLHSRDLWLKEARTVRLGEEPYKMVKGFSNRSRKARMMSEEKEEKDLPLFGEWQTEEYQPPIAVDGKVPRNEYGNVYLFKPCMIPVGCVHVRLPNLHRVAKKLNLDAVPAVTGFDYHAGYSHAVTDGYIVCEEDEEILRAAWVEEQEIQKQKEKEKKEKRAISNWTLLVKGVLIKERLKQRYSMNNQLLGNTSQGGDKDGFSSDEEAVASGSPKTQTASETLAMSWPQNRQAEDEESKSKPKRKTKREKKGQEQHLFPFEKV